MKAQIRTILARIGIAATRPSTLDRLIQSERELRRLRECWEFLANVDARYVHRAIQLLPHAKGENFQDLFAALVLAGRVQGFFVEFGATDGVTGSNSLMFESHFGWRGIVAEPARVWHERLANNRTCAISHECIWIASGDSVEFCEAGDAGFSTIAQFASKGRHGSKRERAARYRVPTISLSDLLVRHDAPSHIDFLSLDTEGSELAILSALPIDQHRISVLVVEHNFRDDREEICRLLKRRGMTRVLQCLSKYDDWYVEDDLVGRVAELFNVESPMGVHLPCVEVDP
jgi:FkbM family methyltransferase